MNTNNQVTTYTYDAAGNLHNDGSTTYNYDGENRLAQVNGTSYIYDGDGNRVMKTNGTAGTLYWRAMAGESISESNLSGIPQAEYIFFGSQRIARRDVPSPSTVHYYFSDRLGSTAVVESVTANGATCDQDIDYYPYGGVINDYCGSVTQHYRFNGKEFDTESGLHNFGARYQDAPIGRLMTPDWAAKPTTVPYASFGNPQSLNLYSFVNNNPTTTRDPNGHVSWGYGGWQGCEVGEENCQKQHKTGEQQSGQANSNNPPAQNRLVAQLEEPEQEEERPEQEAERALEPVEPPAPEPAKPDQGLGQEVISKHSPEDVQAVRNGACSADPKLAEAIRVNDTFNKVKSGGPFSYKQDNTVFQNREGKLPPKPAGYYKEFTISPGSGSGRGAMRLVVGAGGEVYQTNDHYTTFTKIAGQ